MLKIQKKYFFILLIFVALFSFWRIGQHDLQEWDESRNGVNAYEMYHNHDYVNYYYEGKLDTWNAKPPLMIWLIVLSYKVFGFNEFALRFPSVVASFIFLIFCFKIIKLFESEKIAVSCCLMLISCKAILGNHIGLTGDFDALLIMWLVMSVYYFILYVEKQKKYSIYLMAICTGMAFYTKGTASLLFIPGFLLYLIIRKKGLEFIKDFKIWIAILLFLSIACSWLLLVYFFGKYASQSFYGSSNSIETMLIHDTFNRLTNPSFDSNYRSNHLFFFEVIDARLNLWNYLFYLSVIIGVYYLFINRKRLLNYINEGKNHLLLLSVSLILPLALILTFATSKHNWYLAPIFMFIALITTKGIYFIGSKWNVFYFIAIILFLFTFIRHNIELGSQSEKMHQALTSNENLKNENVIIVDELKQDMLLYLFWINANITKVENLDQLYKFNGQLGLLHKDRVSSAVEPIQYFDEYCIVKIK
jgi:4-amino-4-deoxy-L-arabinose transferase-like glycosyltransferase